MKKKIALLLAGVMALTAMPTSLFAATSNSLSNVPNDIPEKTVLVESGVHGKSLTVFSGANNNNNYTSKISAMVDGPNLELELKDELKEGEQITLRLENARWFFRANQSVNLTELNSVKNNKIAQLYVNKAQQIRQTPFNDPANLSYAQARSIAAEIQDFLDRNAANTRYVLNTMLGVSSTNLASYDAKVATVREIIRQQLASSETGPLTYTPAPDEYVPTDYSKLSSWAYLLDNFDNSTTYYGISNAILSLGMELNYNASGELHNTDSRESFVVDEYNSNYSIGAFPTDSYPSSFTSNKERTYDVNNGYWVYNPSIRTQGTYYRFGHNIGSESGVRDAVPYVMQVSGSNDKEATITFGSAGGSKVGTKISIPIVTLTDTDTEDVKVTVYPGNLSIVSGGTFLMGVNKGTSTTNYVDEKVDGRLEFPLGKIIFKEERINTIGNSSADSSVTLTAPSGYYFSLSGSKVPTVNDNLLDATTKTGFGDYAAAVHLDADLSWNSPKDQAPIPTLMFSKTSDYFEQRDRFDVVKLTIPAGKINRSTKTTGALYITGLKLMADEDAPWGPINIKVTNSGLGISEKDILVGERVDWTLNFKTVNAIPKLINGRYEGTMSAAEDAHHKTARVEFSERATSAWWSGRDTIFELRDSEDGYGAKFRKIKITTLTNVQDGDLEETTYVNDGKYAGKVLINGGKMTWSAVKVKRADDSVVSSSALKKATIQFDIWASLESGYVGNLMLGVSGDSIPTATAPADIAIATVINPVEIDAEVTDIKIGYQYYQVADFSIRETEAGALLKNKEVRISISDRIYNDISFTSDFVVAERVTGDIKYSKPKLSNSDGWAQGNFGYDNRTSYIQFVVEGQSTKPSEIKFSNVSLKIDRTVPESQKPYQLYAWGDAIARNYYTMTYFNTTGYTSVKALDTFDTPGIHVDYLNVISAADDKASVLANEVKVTIGETYYVNNGTTSEMDAAAYISEESNSTMVPVRFVANAFGFQDSQIIWDDTNKVVSIIDPNGKVVQFQANSDKMIINGAAITMLSPDLLPVKAEIKGERMYLPFRALGDAFGVPVTWDAASKTAIYNEK